VDGHPTALLRSGHLACIVTARFFEIPAEAVMEVSRQEGANA
jgi:hypothetical protein